MIKVLQVIGSLNYGGIESVIMNYYRKIDRTKLQFDFITTTAGGRFESEIESLGGKIFYLPSKSRHPFQYMKQLKRVIKENNYDIVHSNTNSASAFLDLYPAKIAKCKVRIAHSHNTSCIIKWQHRLFKPLLPFVVTHRFACSEPAAKWLFGNKDYTIIKNGVDFDKFAFNYEIRNKIRKDFGWENNLVIGNVASFQVRKNQRFLIELMPALINDIPNVRLVLVGAGETESDLRQLCKDLSIQEKVVFLGARKNVNEILQALDIFCFPSFYEGLAVAYIEAIASGLPVIISDGVPYVTIGEKVKRLELNKSDWILQILKDYENINDRQPLSVTEITSSGYDINILAKKLENIYGELIK